MRRGMDSGAFRSDVDIQSTAALIMQSVLGAMRLRSLGVELNGAPIDGEHIYEFCLRSLLMRRIHLPDLRLPAVLSDRPNGLVHVWRSRGNVITSFGNHTLPGGEHALTRASLSGVRRRQPLL